VVPELDLRLLALAALLLAGCGPRAGENLLGDPGFESGGKGWSAARWQERPGDAVSGPDRRARTGGASLRVHQDSPNDTAVRQTVRVRPGRVYRLAGWVASEGAKSPEGERVAALGVEGAWAASASVSGDSGWTYRELWVKTAPGQRRLTVSCRLGHHASAAAGTAWFDDLSLEERAPPPGTGVVELPAGADYDADPLLLRPAVLAAAVALLCGVLALLLRLPALSSGWGRGAAVFFVFALVYGLSSHAVGRGPFNAPEFPFARSQFDHYVLLADAFRHGRLDITENLYEVAVKDGRIYVMEPLFPALLLLPFVAAFGPGFHDVLFLVLLGALNVALMDALWPKLDRFAGKSLSTPQSRYWLALLFGLGSAQWYLSIAGRVWHMEGVVALSCLLAALHEALGRGRPVLVGAALGAGFLSHPAVVFAFPFFAAALSRRWSGEPPRRELGRWAALGAAAAAELPVASALYNRARFGSFTEAGLSQSAQSAAAAAYGLVSWRHIPPNFVLNLLRAPELMPRFPFLRPEAAAGFSLFLASPAFLLAARARGRLAAAAGAAAFCVQLFLMMYHTGGWTQFGHRRSLDFLPFLLILTALGAGPRFGRGAKALVVASIASNFLGVFWYYALH
jgi:hypothetical protein